MPDRRIPNVTIQNAKLRYRNFKGAEGRYNVKGNRHFTLFLDPEVATELTVDGWNVKQLKPREEGDPPQDIIEVTVKYSEKARPPRIIMITSRGRTNIEEKEIDMLDYAEIETVDLIIRPYQYEVQGRTGVKAYLQSMYVTIREDELERKYADVPDSAAAAREYTDD